MIGLGFVIMLALGLFFYRVAELENRRGILWGGGAMLLYILSAEVLELSLLGALGVQALLFAALWALIFRERERRIR